MDTIVNRFVGKTIYVICSAYYKTGGTEVLHQLVYHINQLGGNAFVAYINTDKYDELCNPAFVEYVEGHITVLDEVTDDESSIIVIPEGYPAYHKRFTRAIKMLWWLSVDNFEGIYNFEEDAINKVFEEFSESIAIHLVQSKYAEEYLLRKKIPSKQIYHLADYINQEYLNSYKEISFQNREDIILYNPKKGKQSTESIISTGIGLNFVPLQNMSNDEVVALMKKAKLYIDFGNHPGKDRMPREAALCGCIVLTGKHGSAAFFDDISIPEKYKMDESESSSSKVVEVIKKCLQNYDSLISDFDYYRKKILNEKNEFIGDVERLFFGRGNDIASDYFSFRFEKIKLIIWDLDETFWRGTLSEGNVVIPEENKDLIRCLVDHGIVNSISSKNDEEPVEGVLKANDLLEYFVFNTVNWEEKGTQIADKIKAMGLRAENTLFIDDNPRNLQEAKHYSVDLMVATPDIIPFLSEYFANSPITDPDHNRLNQYRILEKKSIAEKNVSSKEDFLYGSEIRITINRNCLEELDRIYEMVQRTNQLNYTKQRDNRKLLERLITNDWNDCAYIKVHDKFGDYGIVGFYCYNRREERMEHFLFSCRILGMGVEQYVYNHLGCPDFNVAPPVAVSLSKDKEVAWIKESYGEEVTDDKIANNRVRVLLKGPCDMSAIEPYLSGGNITTEFNYINSKGFVTTGQNHSMHIYESRVLGEGEISEILEEVPFLIKGDFETKLFSEEYNVICFSLLQDLSAGLYRNKKTGRYISFSSRNYSLTDPKNAERFINKEIQGHDFDFDEGIIKSFSEEWEFVGNTPIDLLLRNLDYIYEHVPGKPIFIILLGSEIDYEGYNEEFDGLADLYREINPIMQEFAADHDRMRIINPTEFIHSQEDFEDCINHYSRNVYYEIAGRICDYINEAVEIIKRSRQNPSVNTSQQPMGERKDYDEAFLTEETRDGFKVDRQKKKIWYTEIKLFEEFSRFCNENGLRFYADFGTMLGAIRHRGFIPWDDDIDVTMPRPDYQRLTELGPTFFSEPYFLQNYYTDHHNNKITNFSRLRDSRTTLFEEDSEGYEGYNQGIFIDIFPLDLAENEPNSTGGIFTIAQEIWEATADPKALLQSIISGYTPVTGTDTILEIMGMPYEERLKLFEGVLNNNYDRSEYVNVFSRNNRNAPKKKEWYKEVLYLPFENIEVPVPIGYDNILKSYYGDYMVPVKFASDHQASFTDPDKPYYLYTGKN